MFIRGLIEFTSQCRIDRYLLRHETANRAHYGRLHPPELSYENRLRCLDDLRKSGFMVRSPGQTPATLADDLKLVERFHPETCGIGPFVPLFPPL